MIASLGLLISNRTLAKTFKLYKQTYSLLKTSGYATRGLLGGWWYPSPKIVINIPGTHEKLPSKGEP